MFSKRAVCLVKTRFSQTPTFMAKKKLRQKLQSPLTQVTHYCTEFSNQKRLNQTLVFKSCAGLQVQKRVDTIIHFILIAQRDTDVKRKSAPKPGTAIHC